MCEMSLTLPRGAMGLSAVCDCVFPDHTDLLFWTSSSADVV